MNGLVAYEDSDGTLKNTGTTMWLYKTSFHSHLKCTNVLSEINIC